MKTKKTTNTSEIELKPGDKVTIKSTDWYDSFPERNTIGTFIEVKKDGGCVHFSRAMREFCGQELTIDKVTSGMKFEGMDYTRYSLKKDEIEVPGIFYKIFFENF